MKRTSAEVSAITTLALAFARNYLKILLPFLFSFLQSTCKPPPLPQHLSHPSANEPPAVLHRIISIVNVLY